MPAIVKLGILAILASGLSFSRAQGPPTPASATQGPSFEVASIKPSRADDNDRGWHLSSDRITIENYTLRELIVSAYGLKSTSQVIGGPDWIDKKHFDIAAKVDDSELASLRAMSREDRHTQWNLMLQSLLRDRFGLGVSRGRRKLPIFSLLVAKSGIKFTATPPDEKNHDLSVKITAMTATAISMETLADYLTREPETEDRIVVNRTGLTGDYNFKLNWTRDRGNGVPADAALPGLLTAIREQLGLELKPDKAPVDVVIVQAAAEPEFD